MENNNMRFKVALLTTLFASTALAGTIRIETGNGVVNDGTFFNPNLTLDLSAHTEDSGIVRFEATQDVEIGGPSGFVFDASTGNLTLGTAGAGIETTPGNAGGQIQLDEAAGNVGGVHSFTLKVVDNLDEDYVCTIEEDGDWEGDCPTGGGGGDSDQVTQNEDDIAANVTDIAANLASIGDNDTDISSNSDAISVCLNPIGIDLADDIADNLANIVTLQTAGTGTLGVLTDVDLGTPSDNDVLTYDSASSEWKSGGDVTALTASVTANTGSIATNTGNISTNTGNISTNTGNISTNTGDIADLQEDVAIINLVLSSQDVWWWLGTPSEDAGEDLGNLLGGGVYKWNPGTGIVGAEYQQFSEETAGHTDITFTATTDTLTGDTWTLAANHTYTFRAVLGPGNANPICSVEFYVDNDYTTYPNGRLRLSNNHKASNALVNDYSPRGSFAVSTTAGVAKEVGVYLGGTSGVGGCNWSSTFTGADEYLWVYVERTS